MSKFGRTPEEEIREQKFSRLATLSKQLHLPFVQAFYHIRVIDAAGNEKYNKSSRSESYTRNMYNFIMCNLGLGWLRDTSFQAGSLSLKRTTSAIAYDADTLVQIGLANYNTSIEIGSSGFCDIANSAGQGILVGTSDFEEDFEDYELNSKVLHGTGLGQLVHAASSLLSKTWINGQWEIQHQRTYTNNSNGTIVIREIAQTADIYYVGTTSTGIFMIARDIVEDVTVLDTEELQVTYEYIVVFPGASSSSSFSSSSFSSSSFSSSSSSFSSSSSSFSSSSSSSSFSSSSSSFSSSSSSSSFSSSSSSSSFSSSSFSSSSFSSSSSSTST